MSISNEEQGNYDNVLVKFEQYSMHKDVERNAVKTRNNRITLAGVSGIGGTILGLTKLKNFTKSIPTKYKAAYLGATVGLPLIGAALSHRVALSSREKANNILFADTVGISNNAGAVKNSYPGSERVKKSWVTRKELYGRSGKKND